MKKDIIRILNKRAEHFEKIHHSFEAREMKSAIDTIERLMPPELFSIPVVVGRSEQLICDTCKSGLINYPEINRRTCSCGRLGYNVTD